MSTKRALTIVLIASVMLLAVGIAPRFTGAARALPPAQAGVTIPYSGRLSDEAGQPVPDGAYAFTFALYAAESGGEPVWTETQEDVAVQGGAFTALLGSVAPLPQEALDGGARWLEVGVRGPGESEFTALAPRQELSAAAPASLTSPSAGPSCAHNHVGEFWCTTTTGLEVGRLSTCAGAGLVYNGAILAPGSGNGLEAYSLLGAGDGVVGTSMTSNKSGVYGNNTGDGYGVYGSSANGYGGFFSGAEHLDLGLGGAIGRINAHAQDESLLYLSSNADVIVKLDNDGGENHNFLIKQSGNDNVFGVDEPGNMWALGTKNALVETAHYGRRLLYAMESPEVWFEDLGTARLTNGEVTVTIDPIFAETVNLEEDYHVFMTPLCQEPLLLFVTAKAAAGFTVRGVTLDGKPAECVFDYRVVAKRLGNEDTRLAPPPAGSAGDDGR